MTPDINKSAANKKDIKLLTLFLLLRTMPKEQQTLLMSHFSPDVANKLNAIEKQSGASSVEQLDWTPFYQSWPELKKILTECRKEAKTQSLVKLAEDQRPLIKEYMLVKMGLKKKGAPVILPPEVIQIIDHYIISNK